MLIIEYQYFKSTLPIIKKFYFVLFTPLLIHKNLFINLYKKYCIYLFLFLYIYLYLYFIYIILYVSYISLTNNGHGCVLTWSG